MVDVIDQFCVCDIFPAAAAGLASLLLSRGGGSLREETANGPASADSRVMAKLTPVHAAIEFYTHWGEDCVEMRRNYNSALQSSRH